jgi:dolichyl-phosphate beta-glucosyltransferase
MDAAEARMQTTLVVPCYNEAARLAADAYVLALEADPGLSFLFVDDGSSDGTRGAIERLASHPRIAGLILPRNVGKAEAVRQGMRQALTHAPDAVGFWDADLATPLAELPLFVDVLRQRPDIDMVIGSRVKLLGRRIRRRSSRHYFGRVAATAVSLLLGLAVYDTQCGAKLFRVERTFGPPPGRLFEKPFSSRWAFDVEILARWIGGCPAVPREELEQRIVELPLRTWSDMAGSKVGGLDFIRTPIDLARIAIRYRSELGR